MMTYVEFCPSVNRMRRSSFGRPNSGFRHLGARIELDKAIAGWDAVVEQANKTHDFTRKASWEAIIGLDLRLNNEGGSFRAYLVNARDTAARSSPWARMKQYHAAHILGRVARAKKWGTE